METNETEDRKKKLIDALEKLKTNQISEFEFEFTGSCGNPHQINTKESSGSINPGQFFEKKCHCGDTTLYLFVGTGMGCVDYEEDSVNWFLVEGEEGVAYFGTDTFEEMRERGFNLIS